MKYLNFLIATLILNLTISCGICLPSNLKFKNKKYFTAENLNGIDLNSQYSFTKMYEATRNLKKIINGPIEHSENNIKFQPDGFIKADFWYANNDNQQGIIYAKRGLLFINKIESTQDRCKSIATYRVKIESEKIILIQYSGITNQKMVYEYTKIN